MHQTLEVSDGRRDSPRDEIIGDVKNCEPLESAYIGRDHARDPISNEIHDSEKRKVCDAPWDLAGDSLPIGNDNGGEAREPADGGGDVAGHVTGSVGPLEDGVLGLSTKGDVGDPSGLGVTADAIPVVATVGARPRVEDAQVGLVESCLEGQQCCPVRRRAPINDSRSNG